MSEKIQIDVKLWQRIVRAMGSGKDETVLAAYKAVRESYDKDGKPK